MTWLDVLKSSCQERGLTTVGKQLGYSKTTISQVINRKYPGDLERIQKQVEAQLMQNQVECPFLGDIALSICLQHQERKFSVTNPMRVQMYRACRQQCPHSRLVTEV